MDLGSIAAGFRKRFRTVDGRSFYGEMTAPTATPRQGSLDPPPRVLRTSPNAVVTVGDVMVTPLGRRYILGRHPTNEVRNFSGLEFRLFDVDLIYPWARAATVIDPVTKLAKVSGAPQDLGLVYCALMDPAVQIDSSTNTRKVQYRFLANAEVQTGDILNGSLKVVAVTPQLGLWFAEVE